MGDFILLKKAIDVIKLKEHLTTEGLKKLVSIKASINWGFAYKLKGAFPGLVYVDRPLIKDQKILDPYWLAGFTSGEGCFYISIHTKANSGLQLVFSITQHIRDKALMNSLISYLGCGNIKHYENYSWLQYIVSKFSDIDEKIIPIFKENQILGDKFKDFQDWCRAAELMKNKAHLTPSGLEKIRKLKNGMNRGRKS